MTFTERKELRLNLLKELYDYYFNNNGSWFKVSKNSDEVKLAYKYLEEKGFIAYSEFYQQGSVMITASGIDFVEAFFKDIGSNKE